MCFLFLFPPRKVDTGHHFSGFLDGRIFKVIKSLPDGDMEIMHLGSRKGLPHVFLTVGSNVHVGDQDSDLKKVD